jgi:DNA-binding MarR family transcriptional regulator
MADLPYRPGWHIMHVSYGVYRRLNAFLEGLPMTTMEARALLFIASVGGDVCQRDIEREFGLSAATVSELIRGMADKGLVRRTVDPSDRRRRRVIIADETHPQLEAMREYLAKLEQTLIELIPPGCVEDFINVLKRMAELYPPNARPNEIEIPQK